jgi:hypothetical protein
MKKRAEAAALEVAAPPVAHEPATAPRGLYFLFGDEHSGHA